jgi:hypothetical protein
MGGVSRFEHFFRNYLKNIIKIIIYACLVWACVDQNDDLVWGHLSGGSWWRALVSCR